MTEPVKFFKTQAELIRSNIPWVARLQAEALDSFVQKGIPDRHQEDWKYTIVEPVLQQFVAEKSAKSDTMPQASYPFDHILIGKEEVPQGVIVMPLSEAFATQAELLQKHLSLKGSAFHDLNTANLQQGYFIYIPKAIQLEKPLVLLHQTQNIQHIRNIVIAQSDSSVTLIEDYLGDNPYFINTITDIYLHPKAKVAHYKIQRESKTALHIGLVNVKQAQGSEFSSHSLNVGGLMVRSDTAITFEGSQASCLMNGMYLPIDGQHIDHHTEVQHQVPDCKSTQDYKGILMGHSRAVFNGKVYVAKDAQHTDASQNNKNLLLSKGAEIDTKPQLEIFADDVICTHGAAVGQLDEDALFYLATRGIDREEASAFLIHAFVSQNLALIPDAPIADWMAGLINEQLELQA